MNLHIWNALTLNSFTDFIRRGFVEAGVAIDHERPADCTLIQIHGAPAALNEDQELIERARRLNTPKAFLIHRPDEALLYPYIRSYFETVPDAKLLFLGDLIFRDEFWNKRRKFSSVAPHPQLDYGLPQTTGKPIVGTFTSWGEMRDVRHFFALAECLNPSGVCDFWIGGTGLDEIKIPDFIHRSTAPFAAHFNVQLYHLNGKKRYGESSGSLHRGISIPIIFEANGAERLEDLEVIKVEADDELISINFEAAAEAILKINDGGIDLAIARNLKAAQANSVRLFAERVLNAITI